MEEIKKPIKINKPNVNLRKIRTKEYGTNMSDNLDSKSLQINFPTGGQLRSSLSRFI